MKDSTLSVKENKSDLYNDLSNEDKCLGRFFFGCNVPFSVVESDFFKHFSSALNPNYIPPTRKTLSSSLLDKTYNEVIKRNSTKVNEKSVFLLDGWKNSSKNEKYVVGIIHNAHGERLF